MSTRAGRLRDRVQLIRDVTPDSPSGGTAPWTTYTTVAEVWALVEPRRGGREQAGTLDWNSAKTPYDITIRYRTDITEKDRVLFDQRQFHIDAVPRGSRKQEVIVMPCWEIN